MEIYKNEAYDAFRCIAQDCPDSCCQLWEVEVDADTAARYAALPGALGRDIRRNLLETEEGAVFQVVDDRCPMWRLDGLCRIQAELGHEALCATCRQFPRLTHDYGDFQEWGLELSCPEAAGMLLNRDWPQANTCLPGGDAPEYDALDMQELLSSREEALSLLRQFPIAQALAALLLYGARAQGALDGEELAPWVPDSAPETARQFQTRADFAPMLDFLKSLEILTPAWQARLEDAAPVPAMDSRTLRLADYLIHRYWLQSVSDLDLYARVKWIVSACLIVNYLGGDFVRTAQQFSKEIENCTENLDAFLDAAYDNPAFTDANLLGLLARCF